MRRFANFIFPYAIILLVSLAASYVLFYDGFAGGDDFVFHIPNIYELYLNIKSGEGISYISNYIMNGLGSGTRLFYSPLPHLTVAYTAILLEPFGISLLTSFQIVIFFTVYLSGIFMYHFALKLTRGRRVAALIVASIYVVYPYRLFDLYCRLAFAEGFAFMFLPLFFAGLYQIINEDEIHVTSFLKIIIGGGLLFLSHNITALYTYIFGVFFLVLNIKKVIKSLKKPNFILWCGISVVLMVGLMALTVLPTLELMNTGIYNVTDRDRMWTSIDYVTGRAGEEYNYSGFINFWYLEDRYNYFMSAYGVAMCDKQSTLLFQFFSFLLISGIYGFIAYQLKRLKKFKYSRLLLILSITYIVILRLFAPRIDVILAGAIVILLVMSCCLVNHKEEEKKKNRNILLDSTFYFLIISIPVLFLMMESEWIWTVLPALFLNIQFPWRLWALVQIFVPMLVGLFFNYYPDSKPLKFVVSIATGFLFAINMPLYEKAALTYENEYAGVFNTIDDWFFETGGEMGWNKEYMPQVFVNSDYVSEYENSLYSVYKKFYFSTTITAYGTGVANVERYFCYGGDAHYRATATTTSSIFYTSLPYIEGAYTVTMIEDNDEEHVCEVFNNKGNLAIYFPEEATTYSIYVTYNRYSITSRVLYKTNEEPNGTITNAVSGTGTNSFTLTATDKVLVQVPLVYYPGYEIKLTSDDGKVTYAESIMTDGLVSFEAEAGTYNVEINYVGTTIRQASNAVFKMAIAGIFIFSCYGVLYERKKKQDLY